jgi:hypothetical protein
MSTAQIMSKPHETPGFDAVTAIFCAISALVAGWHGPCDIPFEPDEKLTNQRSPPTLRRTP